MTDLFQTILTMSASAGLLALLVIGARALLARRQTVMLTVLFALLIAKLVVPLSIESPASLQNLVNTADISAIAVETPVIEQSLPDIETQLTAADTPAVVDAPAAAENTTQQNSGASGSSPEAQVIPQAAADAPPATNVESFTDNMTASEAPVLAIPDAIPQTETPPPWQPTGWDIAAIVWLSGIAVLSTVIAFSNIRFMLRLRRNRAYTAPGFDEMLSDCRKEFGIKRNIPAVQVSEINTAAVCGIFRPKLMISPRTFGALTTGQQRHVLMHEVSHIRRMDTLTCLIVTILSVVHWFNPLVWLAFRLMRSDLEVMCDAKVLKKLETDERRSYAQTLFGLIQKRGAQSVRLVAALFMSRSSIKRRITMIAKYKKTSPLFTALALLLTVLIAVTGCTSAMPNAAGEASTEETPPEFTAEYDDHDATEQNVIGEYTLDISGIASDEARMHNIEKAVGYFNDIVLTPAIEHEFYPSQVITGENDWQTARSADFDAIIQLLEDGEARSFDELMLDQPV